MVSYCFFSFVFKLFISIVSAYNHAEVPAPPNLLFLCFLLKALFRQSFSFLSNIWKKLFVLAPPTSSSCLPINLLRSGYHTYLSK